MVKRPTQKPQDRDWHVPLAETLEWIAKGEKLQKQWAKRRGPVAEKMLASLQRGLDRLRKDADKLWALHKSEQKSKKAK
jgi:hypothetical protein